MFVDVQGNVQHPNHGVPEGERHDLLRERK